MSDHSEGLKVEVGDGAEPEVFNELGLMEVPEFFGSSPATYPNRTTKDAGTKLKKVGMGLEEGEEIALVYHHDFDDLAQDSLRAAKGSNAGVNIKVTITDGTTTEVYTANFLVLSTPYQRADPNGDGDPDRETANVRRNSDWAIS
jgi:hypothetical protein